MSINYFDFNKKNIPVSKQRTTTLPTPKEFWERAQRQDHPGLTIRNIYHPAVQSSVTIVSDKYRESLPESMTIPSVTVSLSNMRRVESRSDIELQKYIPNGKRYHPDVGGSPFIPGSAKPVPPVLAQSAIKACAEFCALKRAQGGDPTPIKNYFRKMWGLPDSFDPEDYSPVIKADRTKPWLRANKPANYEVVVYPTQQSMITVKLGNTRSLVMGNKLNIDWDLIRVHLRQIATRVFFGEPGRLEQLKKDDVTLYFQLRYENFEIESDELTVFNDNAPAVCNALTSDELLLLATKNEKFVAQPLKGLIAQALPDETIEEMQSQSEEKLIKIQHKQTILDKYLDELSLSHDYGPFSIISAPRQAMTKTMTLRSVMKWAIRNWILQKNSNLQAMTQAMGYYEYLDNSKAMEILRENMDWKYLDKVFVAWKKLRSDLSDPKAGAELKNLFFDSNVTKVKYNLDTLETIFTKSMFKKCVVFLEICCESFRSARINFSYLSIHDFVTKDIKPFEITIPNLRDIAYAKISSFYKNKYIAKAKFHINQFKLYKEPSERLKAIKYQMRSKLYPLMNNKARPWSINDVFLQTMEKYVKKRKKLQAWWEYEKSEKLSLIDRLNRFDEKAKTRFYEYYKESVKLSELTWQDIDTYFLSEDSYLEKWHKNAKFKRKTEFIRSKLHSNLQANTKEFFSKTYEDETVFQDHCTIQDDVEENKDEHMDSIDDSVSSDDESKPIPVFTPSITLQNPVVYEVKKTDNEVVNDSMDFDALLGDYEEEEAVYQQSLLLSDFFESKSASVDLTIFFKYADTYGYSFDPDGFNDPDILDDFWGKYGMEIVKETRLLWQQERVLEKNSTSSIPQSEDLF